MLTTPRKYTVLFVDDEPRITSALKAIFRREYSVLTANSGAQALQIMDSHTVDVLVSDQRMPNMLGHQLLAKASKRHPQTMRILLTGFMDKQAIVESINDGEVYRFINKPWKNDAMREVIAEAALASEIAVASPPSASGKSPALTPPTSADTVRRIRDQALLMMEQKQEIRHQIRRFCSDHDIMIYGTQSIQQAVAAATSRDAIGVAVIELSDNTAAALQTISLLKQARPELITIALTEDYDATTAVDLINHGQVFKYLAKPLDIGRFQSAIENAFTRHRFLKTQPTAKQRYRVQKPTGRLASGLQELFNKLLTTAH